MSPVWRFSNQATGSRIRCANTLDSHCRLSVADSTSTAHERTAPVATCSSTSSPKPSPSVTSRSRSPLTSTPSTTHCSKNGDSSRKASSTSASTNTCASARLRPLTRPSSRRRLNGCRSTRGAKPPAGVSSRAMPVKCRDSSASFRRRTPCPGSWITATPRCTATSTTKWFMSQCSTQGSCRPARCSGSARSARGASCSSPAMRTRSPIDAPLSDSEKRRRSVGRSVCRPCAAATIAMQARPHSAASVCSNMGTRRRGRQPRFRRSSIGGYTRPAMPSSGSKIHSISRRRSSCTSASSCMPGSSGCGWP